MKTFWMEGNLYLAVSCVTVADRGWKIRVAVLEKRVVFLSFLVWKFVVTLLAKIAYFWEIFSLNFCLFFFLVVFF